MRWIGLATHRLVLSSCATLVHLTICGAVPIWGGDEMASVKRAEWGVVVRLADGTSLFYSPESGRQGPGGLESSGVAGPSIRDAGRCRTSG